MLSILTLIAGLVVLVFAGDYLVRGAVALAEKLSIDPLIIGLTIVAFGTSAPELFVSFQAALDGVSGIAIGNVVGSNIFNLLGSGAIISFFGPTELAPTFLQFDHWAMGGAAIALGLFVVPRSRVTRLAALAMLLAYGVYVFGLVHGWNITGEVESWIGRA